MRFLCGMILVVVSACQENKQNTENAPDAVRDLLVDRSFWEKKALPSSRDRFINVHRFTITNTSHHYLYREIEVRFDYYDNEHHKVESSERTINRSIEPRSAVKIDDMQAGSANPSVTSATVTILDASVD